MEASTHTYFRKKRVTRYKSTVHIATADAHSLVNGPTIYLTNDINIIAHFCIQSMKFPDNIIKNISKTIESNS